MAYDQDAVDAAVTLMQPQIDALAARVAAVEASGRSRVLDDAQIGFQERLMEVLLPLATDDERARVFDALRATL